MKKIMVFLNRKECKIALMIIVILMDFLIPYFGVTGLVSRYIFWYIVMPILFVFNYFDNWIYKSIFILYETFLFVASVFEITIFTYESVITTWGITLPFSSLTFVQPLLLCLLAMFVNKIRHKKRKRTA